MIRGYPGNNYPGTRQTTQRVPGGLFSPKPTTNRYPGTRNITRVPATLPEYLRNTQRLLGGLFLPKPNYPLVLGYPLNYPDTRKIPNRYPADYFRQNSTIHGFPGTREIIRVPAKYPTSTLPTIFTKTLLPTGTRVPAKLPGYPRNTQRVPGGLFSPKLSYPWAPRYPRNYPVPV